MVVPVVNKSYSGIFVSRVWWKGIYLDFYSIMSEGSGSDSDADNESRDGVDVETDEEDGMYFDTNDFLSSESLRSASYRRRENMGNDCSPLMHDKESSFSDRLCEIQMEIKPIEYPFIKRRDSLPEPKEKEKPVSLWSIIKDNIGKDLSGVCLPVYFNELLSSLQKCFEDLEYSYLIDRALEWEKQGNDLMRILNVAAFAVSGYASTEGRQCKPFNPLLRETYEADYPDKGLRFFSEKANFCILQAGVSSQASGEGPVEEQVDGAEPVDDIDLWMQAVGGRKKGRVYGMRSEASVIHSHIGRAPPPPTSTLTPAVVDMTQVRQEIAGMFNSAMDNMVDQIVQRVL